MKPQYIEDAIADWLPAMNSPDPNFNDWKVLHIIFERIHPFIDFNGRVGRMFMNWRRLMSGMPLMTIYEKDRNKYYEWFKE
jgi:Fic family protein